MTSSSRLKYKNVNLKQEVPSALFFYIISGGIYCIPMNHAQGTKDNKKEREIKIEIQVLRKNFI